MPTEILASDVVVRLTLRALHDLACFVYNKARLADEFKIYTHGQPYEPSEIELVAVSSGLRIGKVKVESNEGNIELDLRTLVGLLKFIKETRRLGAERYNINLYPPYTIKVYVTEWMGERGSPATWETNKVYMEQVPEFAQMAVDFRSCHKFI